MPNLTKGPIARSILAFAIPVFFGQLLQQLYNLADAWVIGNFADNNAFAAISSTGSLVFFVVGFFNGMAIGGSVIISRYYGAGDKNAVVTAIHTNFLLGILCSVFSTVVGLLIMPFLLSKMQTPAEVMPFALSYLRIYFGGVATMIMYNICMAIMRALGDSLHPLYYLLFSSCVNVALDLLFVAVFHWGVRGAAAATIVSQGLSFLLCLVRMRRVKDFTRLDFKKLQFHRKMMREVVAQGLPTGIQNSVISIGNIVVQTNINSFGAFAMSGVGAYSKIEGFVFLPIVAMSSALPTFIGQNLGAKEYGRAKRGAVFGILSGMVMAAIIGICVFAFAPSLVRIFVDTEKAVFFGQTQARTTSLFFFLLAFSHCAAGVLRGCGKSIIPMITMLSSWCGVRILYVTCALHFIPEFRMIPWAYPLTWGLSSIVFLLFLLCSDWTHGYEK